MDMLKVIGDGQLLDVSNGFQPYDLIASLAKGIQVEPEGDKAIDDANIVVISPRDAPKEKLPSKEGQ